ncbi:amidohydrolase [Arenibacter sp. 6A1]|uniref:amidohydrolase n=1 Tax=Arenibacter sp. 6A1 TaxID=2720391 RepID=UPI001444FD0C|nr:amidohydrolase [Arenibacter sp. 6A1]NKI26457.1 amidohydrolase [Arenibacter sp. 6A1]
MGNELKVALVQSSLVWENPDQNRTNFKKQIAAISKDTDLVILPEMFTSGFTMHPENMAEDEGYNTLLWMQQVAKEHHMAIVGSAAYYENGTYTNRLLFVTPDGDCSYYDKRHTFTLAGENQVYAAGKNKLILHYKGFKICPLICYDLRFPVWARNVEEYDILIYVANWPKQRIVAWDTLLKARAIENMAYVIGVNRIGLDNNGHEYSGHSAVYDLLGHPLVFSDREEVLYASLTRAHITKVRKELKFLDDRDGFTLKG